MHSCRSATNTRPRCRNYQSRGINADQHIVVCYLTIRQRFLSGAVLLTGEQDDEDEDGDDDGQDAAPAEVALFCGAFCDAASRVVFLPSVNSDGRWSETAAGIIYGGSCCITG